MDHAAGETQWLTLTLSAVASALLTGIWYGFPKALGTIAVFALALIAGRFVDFSSLDVATIGAVDTNLPSPVPPELSLADLGRLLPAALGLALLIVPNPLPPFPRREGERNSSFSPLRSVEGGQGQGVRENLSPLFRVWRFSSTPRHSRSARKNQSHGGGWSARSLPALNCCQSSSTDSRTTPRKPARPSRYGTSNGCQKCCTRPR